MTNHPTEQVDRVAAIIREHRFERWSVASQDRNEWWGHCTGCGYESKPRSGFQPEWELNMRDDEALHIAGIVAAALDATTPPPEPQTKVDYSGLGLIDSARTRRSQSRHLGERDQPPPQGWLKAEFERARKRSDEVPPRARPVVREVGERDQ